MVGEPNEIEGGILARFLSTHQVCVVWARPLIHATFHKTLRLLFEEWYNANTAFISINSSMPDFSNAMAQLFGKGWMVQLGIWSQQLAPEGYYLFQNGRVVGYYPQPKRYEGLSQEMRDGLNLSIIALAAYKALIEHDLIGGLEIFTDPSELLQALRMYSSLMEQIRRNTKYSFQEDQQEMQYRKLQEAYELFGVSPTTTKEDLQRKYWELAKKNYPLTDGPNSAARSAEMARINDLHDLLMKILGFR